MDDIEEFFSAGYTHLILVDPELAFTDKEGKILLEWYKQACFLDKFERLMAMKKLKNTCQKSITIGTNEG